MTAPRPRRIGAHERTTGDPTPGMVREPAFETDGLWAGFVTTEPGSASGWHHHGENETAVYIITGVLRVEFGLDGGEAVDLGPGDFGHVPPGIVHREVNPGAVQMHAVVVRAGNGPPTINVDGPEGS